MNTAGPPYRRLRGRRHIEDSERRQGYRDTTGLPVAKSALLGRGDVTLPQDRVSVRRRDRSGWSRWSDAGDALQSGMRMRQRAERAEKEVQHGDKQRLRTRGFAMDPH